MSAKTKEKLVLKINTAAPRVKVFLYSSDGRLISKKEWLSRRDTGGQLLKTIEIMRKKRQLYFEKLKKIEVYQGEGSYTGIRVGLAVAKTLGFVFKIPVKTTRSWG
ncbi:hypothetical protein HY373_02415 [Candidatus Berkelbacteria bacterium]|nr:hypothetical protein [Candidatus Berkelbacteria bacterium]MBI4030009.1 hypothetical protein [Candidatus Berkelbacteria bacterium]